MKSVMSNVRKCNIYPIVVFMFVVSRSRNGEDPGNENEGLHQVVTGRGRGGGKSK